MVTHHCDKEVILQRIQDDLSYIKKSLTEDNGGGLVSHVKQNTDFRIGYEAKSKAYKYIMGSGWLATFILFLGQLYLNIKGG